MLILFSTTLFVSSFLLFCVQPMIGKMVLPLLGGVPSVWNTCMFFFQMVLLAGYGYVHFLMRRLGTTAQLVLHALVLLLPALTLPMTIGEAEQQTLASGAPPLVWLLQVLVVHGGPPFLAVSTTAPLIQLWFSRTRHAQAKDPYFLYVASNVGSLLGLVAYPFLIEAFIPLTRQNQAWAAGYAALFCLVGICAFRAWKARDGSPALPATGASSPPEWRTSALWIFYAFVPSSLLLGATTYLSSEVGSIPLLWVIPLSLYLLSFVLAFSSRSERVFKLASRWLGFFALTLMVAILTEASQPAFVVIPLHVLTFFVAACVCHGALFKLRPASEHLTHFYFCLSVGGALGGTFNALVAPVIFPQIIEYPLGLVLACLCREGFRLGLVDETKARRDDWIWSAVVAAMTLATGFLCRKLGLEFGRVTTLLAFGLPAVLCYRGLSRPRRFAYCLAALAVSGSAFPGERGQALLVSRNFFGVIRVTRDPTSHFHQLVHGSTLHGRQTLAEDSRKEPLMYYTRSGPAGQIYSVFNKRLPSANVAVVGLGTGALSCLSTPGQRWTYYEIDPAVVEIASASGYFTHFRDCSPTKTEIVMGDARVQLRKAPPGYYDLLVIDAFNSDAIPVHLATREAMKMYWDKISRGGWLGFHISNRYLDFKPVLSAISGELGLAAYVRYDANLSKDELARGTATSEWVVMARDAADLKLLVKDERWQPLPKAGARSLWTDEHSNLVKLFKW